MINMLNNKTYIDKFLFLGLFLIINLSDVIAQTKSYGRLIIENTGDMKIYDEWSFRVNTGNTQLGIIGTERRNNKGYISFMPGSSWIGANNTAYIDGYVRTYLDAPFTFPIGDNNSYRPAKVSISSPTNPTEASYFAVNPSMAITSPFFGSVSEVLPYGGPFNTNLKESSISAISTSEYWDINGNTPAKISLSWDVSSGISTLCSGSLANLIIVGWDGSKWVKISSVKDDISIFGTSSNLNSGSITTISTIMPNTYSIYTLGSSIPNKFSIFSSKFISKTVSQTKNLTITHPFNSNISDTNVVVTISQSTPKFGTVSNSTTSGYTYTASNDFIGIDTVLSIASIYNKPTSTYVYDTFIHEMIVRYFKADTNIDMGTLSSINLGKKINKTQNISLVYSFKTKLGSVSNYSNGTFKYQSTNTKATDTLLYILQVNYLGKLTTKDTAKYIIKLSQGSNSILSVNGSNYLIQNYISPNKIGNNDKWVLPQELLDKYPNVAISISTLDGKTIYSSNQYKNEWPSNGDLPDGFYIYQIHLDAKDELNGILRISNE